MTSRVAHCLPERIINIVEVHGGPAHVVVHQITTASHLDELIRRTMASAMVLPAP